MNFPSMRIEGAIFTPDILERLEEASGQRPADFGLEPSAKVKDEIARAWADAQDYWRIFQRKVETLRPGSSAATETRNLWITPLLGPLGYQIEYRARGETVNDKTYAISHRVVNRGETPIHITGYLEPAGLDRKPENATLRMSAHGLLQEYLNLTEQLYGIVTNGRVLRLLRDSSRLVKLTYLEFDLDRIFTDGLYADFALLFRLLHASRLPASKESGADSILERYHQDSLDAGARIRAGLSTAVEQAIRTLGDGFLAHPDNAELRMAVAQGRLTPNAYYQQLLRLIYRLLFLFVIEERNLVYPPLVDDATVATQQKQRTIYQRYYSLQRLRRLAEKRYLADRRQYDHWLGLLATFRLFEADGPGAKLGLAPLAGDLFDPDAIGPLGRAMLTNEYLLGALRALSLYQHPDSRQLMRVNYAALNVEELGSVYEGLLKYRPAFDASRATPTFHLRSGEDDTQSHYTPDDLVQPLLKHSLDYLIADKLKEADQQAALLSLRVADIACGSGHILLAAARRIGTHLATVRTGEEQPSPAAFRAAVRDVIRHCIYGVDLNPLAVELCKVALWLEAHNPGEPLNFLDHHIKCGNAIVGYVHADELEAGVPDAAFAAQLVNSTNGHKGTGAALRARNKAERRNQGQLSLQPSPEIQQQLAQILTRWRAITELPEATPAQIEHKKSRYQAFTQSQDAWLLQQIAAIPLAQFYLPKTNEYGDRHITDGEFREYWQGTRAPQGQAAAAAWAVAVQKRFFHWFLEFPDIMARGGFDCILGNPPYLGGQGLSGTYGYPFCHYVKWHFAPTGLSDLVTYFVRRIYMLLRPGGFTAFITTNSIIDGDVRKDGLEQVVAQGGSIILAVRGVKWPGAANLVVSLAGIHKGAWTRKRLLDNLETDHISSHFEDYEDVGEPLAILENSARMYQGSIFLGMGFILTHEEAEEMIHRESQLSEVIQLVINGQELNNQPNQLPARRIINFHDWPIEKARGYSEAFDRILRLVKPEREKLKRQSRRERWWQYAERADSLYTAIQPLNRCFAATRVTKHFNFSALPTGHVFTDRLYVFATDRWDLYCVVQCTLHEVWARKYSGKLETRLNYSPSECFGTYVFPADLWETATPSLAALGERYHEHRRVLMRQLWLGLTKLYNLFHTPDLTVAAVAKASKQPDEIAAAGLEGILALRRLHRALDEAVLAAYGWQDLDLDHNFYNVETLPENDRTRYTISPAARREVLRRLLALNHERAAEEAKQAALEKGATKAKGKKKKVSDAQLDLLGA